jgi:voltage-dependent potassium channel beta subunit
MQYRRLGRSGLQVSELSLGSWVTYHNQVDVKSAIEMLAAAMDAGVNFFDNAEVYASGKSEVVMGEAFRALKWPRVNYIVSTKFFWGLDREGHATNRKDTLNRKYLSQAIDGSLARMGLDFIDLVYCHRPDPNTPVEETVWAMSDMITRGKALYWGTSEWSAAEIRAAWDIAERHHLHKPVMEQPQYNLLHRERVEKEYARLYDDIGLGRTTWSPLASGLLTGKYRPGDVFDNPDDIRSQRSPSETQEALRQAAEIAATEVPPSVPMAAWALAWCLKHPAVACVIPGCKTVKQVTSNAAGADLADDGHPLARSGS